MNHRPRFYRYQWEAIYTVDFTLDSLRRRCLRFGAALADRAWGCLIGYDTRFLSAQFAVYAYRVIEGCGVRVKYCSAPAPFPAVELALEQKRAECALIVSAGNRPHWYNGLIALAPSVDDGLLDTADLPADQQPLPFPPAPLEEPENNQLDLRTPYFDMLRAVVDVEFIRRSSLTIFVDPMSGGTSGAIPAIVGEGAQARAVEINRESDPLFGRQPPQPVEAGLQRLRKLVKESESHFGVALSADGRAISVADTTGELVSPVELTLLLAQYLVRQYRQKGTVVVPLPDGDTPAVHAWKQATGLRVERADNPGVRMAELLAEDRNSLLAGTTAAGELTLGRYSASPDATLAALLLMELTARSGSKLRPLIDALRGK